MSKKTVFASALAAGVLTASYLFGAFGLSKPASACDCCESCVCKNCSCDEKGCACQTGGDCECSDACCAGCCTK